MTNKMHQIHFRPRVRPGPRWGSSRRSRRPLVGWGGGYPLPIHPLPIPRPLDAYGVSFSAPLSPRPEGVRCTDVWATRHLGDRRLGDKNVALRLEQAQRRGSCKRLSVFSCFVSHLSKVHRRSDTDGKD